MNHPFNVVEPQNEAVQELFTEIGRFRSSKEFQKLLATIRKYTSLSPFNRMLVHIQKPGATFVKEAAHWHKYNRTVKIDARPLIILWPFAPVHFVYDISDTEGDTHTLPEIILFPWVTQGKLPPEIYHRFIRRIRAGGAGFIETSNMGSTMAAQVTRSKDAPNTPQKGKKLSGFYIEINADATLEARFSALIHELAHIMCGHLGTSYPQALPDRRNLSVTAQEFEAETVAWIVSQRMDLNPFSHEYLAQYVDEGGLIPKIRLELVISVAGKIEKMLLP
ncbi:MAG: hypothetical protein ACQEQV_05255 [Fibrobacterota bacterium]